MSCAALIINIVPNKIVGTISLLAVNKLSKFQLCWARLMLALGQENTEISVKIIFQLFLESNKLSISISIKVRWNVRLGKTRKGQLGRTDDCDLKRSHS